MEQRASIRMKSNPHLRYAVMFLKNAGELTRATRLWMACTGETSGQIAMKEVLNMNERLPLSTNRAAPKTYCHNCNCEWHESTQTCPHCSMRVERLKPRAR